MNKAVEQTKQLINKLRVSYRLCGQYQIQVMGVHNFYPTKKTYYNSNTNKKVKYTNDIFHNHSTLMRFLQKNQF